VLQIDRRMILKWLVKKLDNIKMDPLKIGLNVVDWIGLAQDRYSSCKLGNEPGDCRMAAQLVASRVVLSST
jgi:hypothetical protein